MRVMGFLFVMDPFYRKVLRKFGLNELRVTEPPRKFTLELFRFLRLAITATIHDWIVVRMAHANTVPHSQLKVRTRLSPFLLRIVDCYPLCRALTHWLINLSPLCRFLKIGSTYITSACS